MLPNLRTPDASRTELSPDTITMLDLIEAFKVMGDDLARFEMTGESRFLGMFCQKSDLLAERNADLKKRARGLQHALNEREREAREERKRIAQAEEAKAHEHFMETPIDRKLTPRQIRSEENRRNWRRKHSGYS